MANEKKINPVAKKEEKKVETQSVSEQPNNVEPASTPAPVTPSLPKLEIETVPNLTSEEKLFGAIAYLNIGCLITLATQPKSKFCQYHGKQGLLLFIISIAVLFVLALIPFLGYLLMLALCVVSLYGAFNAFTGKIWKIPYLSAFVGHVDLSKIDNLPIDNVLNKIIKKDEQKPVEPTTPPTEEKKTEDKK